MQLYLYSIYSYIYRNSSRKIYSYRFNRKLFKKIEDKKLRNKATRTESWKQTVGYSVKVTVDKSFFVVWRCLFTVVAFWKKKLFWQELTSFHLGSESCVKTWVRVSKRLYNKPRGEPWLRFFSQVAEPRVYSFIVMNIKWYR